MISILGTGEVNSMLRHQLSEGEREEVISSIMIAPSRIAMESFFTMLFLSVIVATVGLVQNSSAVVIGGMMIAPLMSPILGISASTLMGWNMHLARTIALVLLSASGTILLAMAMAFALPQAGVSISNELLARTSFDVRDLVVALAAGAAGTYGLFHKSMSTALPGVAVAVALVPPLATVGVLIERGRSNLAVGAAELFLINIVGIILGSILVMLLSGFVPPHIVSRNRKRMIFSIVSILIPSLILGALLTTKFFRVAQNARNLRETSNAVSNWLGSIDQLARLSIAGSTVHLSIEGSEEPPSIDVLAPVISQILGQPATVDLQWTHTNLDLNQKQPQTTSANTNTNSADGESAKKIITQWVKSHPGVQIIDSVQSGSTITITLASQRIPNVSVLRQDLHVALPLDTIKMQWILGRILATIKPSVAP